MARGLNQRELAEMIGLDQATIQRAEAMASSAKLLTYQKCADALGVTLADLFCEDRTPAEAALIAAFREVPEEKHPRIFDLLEIARDGTQGREQGSGPAENR